MFFIITPVTSRRRTRISHQIEEHLALRRIPPYHDGKVSDLQPPTGWALSNVRPYNGPRLGLRR
jgi:hypothetical protein